MDLFESWLHLKNGGGVGFWLHGRAYPGLTLFCVLIAAQCQPTHSMTLYSLHLKLTTFNDPIASSALFWPLSHSFFFLIPYFQREILKLRIPLVASPLGAEIIRLLFMGMTFCLQLILLLQNIANSCGSGYVLPNALLCIFQSWIPFHCFPPIFL